MADVTHLNELIAQQRGATTVRLLNSFASLVRDPRVASADYPALLRKIMDEIFEETSNAFSKSDGN